MSVTVTKLQAADRADWEVLYHGYAEFYRVPMNDEILETVWGWIHDDDNPFFGLIARDAGGEALGLMHCQQMPSPLRGRSWHRRRRHPCQGHRLRTAASAQRQSGPKPKEGG